MYGNDMVLDNEIEFEKVLCRKQKERQVRYHEKIHTEYFYENAGLGNCQCTLPCVIWNSFLNRKRNAEKTLRSANGGTVV